MPRESLDAPKDLSKQTLRQGAFSKLEDEIPGMPDEAPAGFEQPLLQTRQRPTSDGQGQGKPAQEIAEVVRDDSQKEPHLIGPETVAGEAGPVGSLFPFLDPLLRRPALVVEADDGPVRPGQGGDDEAHAGKELPKVMLDFGDDSPRPVPGGSLILEAAVADQRGVAGSAAWSGQQVLDGPLQHIISGEADGVRHASPLQRLVEGREGEGRVGSDDDGLPPGLRALDDRKSRGVGR